MWRIAQLLCTLLDPGPACADWLDGRTMENVPESLSCPVPFHEPDYSLLFLSLPPMEKNGV